MRQVLAQPISTQAGLGKRQTDWSRRPGVLPCRGGCIATTRFLFRVSISWGFGVVLMRITGAFRNPHPHPSEMTPLIRGDRTILSNLWLRSQPPPRNPAPARARPRMLPAPPRAQSPSRRPPTQPCAPEARLGAAADAWTSFRRMVRCGARRPPQSTRARMPQKFGSGSVGSEMLPKPRFLPNPAQINTHKHSHRRRRGPRSQRRVSATGDQGRARDPPGAAARDRPLKGAT